MTEDGYPTDEELEKLRTWESLDTAGALEFMRSLWHWDDFVSEELLEHERAIVTDIRPVRYLRFATGGWSGNESLIEAFRDNMGWMFAWRLSAAGGLHIFAMPQEHSR